MNAFVSAKIDPSQSQDVSFNVIRERKKLKYDSVCGSEFFRDKDLYLEFHTAVRSLVHGEAIQRQVLAEMQRIVEKAAKLDPSLDISIKGYSVIRHGDAHTEIMTSYIRSVPNRDIRPNESS